MSNDKWSLAQNPYKIKNNSADPHGLINKYYNT